MNAFDDNETFGVDSGEEKFFESGGVTAEEPQGTRQEEGQEKPQEGQEKPQEGQEKPQEGQEKQVPYAALHEERQRRRQLAEELQHERNQRAAEFERLKQEVMEMRQGKQQQSDEEEWRLDPLGKLRKEQEALKQRQEDFTRMQQEASQNYEQVQRQQQTVRAFQHQVASQVNEYKQSAPDYDEAFSHVMTNYDRLLSAHGVPAEQRGQYKAAYMMSLANNAMQQGVNPGQALYDLAKSFGYVPKSATQGSGSQDAELSARLQAIERGQNESRSLSGGGESPKDELSIGEIADLPDDEFDKQWEQLEKRYF